MRNQQNIAGGTGNERVDEREDPVLHVMKAFSAGRAESGDIPASFGPHLRVLFVNDVYPEAVPLAQGDFPKGGCPGGRYGSVVGNNGGGFDRPFQIAAPDFGKIHLP